MGVTGARTQTSSAAPELVGRIRAADPDALIGVGLGVSNGEQAARGDRVRRRGDRRFRSGQDACWRPRTPAIPLTSPGCAPWSPISPPAYAPFDWLRAGNVRRWELRSSRVRVNPVVIRYVRWLVAVGVLLVTVGCTPAPLADAARRASDPAGF